jgi:hypothetical protein
LDARHDIIGVSKSQLRQIREDFTREDEPLGDHHALVERQYACAVE